MKNQFEEPLLTADSALERVGSRGRFQLLAAATLMLSFTLNGHIVYGLSFLTYKGELDLTCTSPTGATGPCSAATACDSALTTSYLINKKGITNWVTSFDLVCVPDSTLTMLGSIFFITFTIGSLLWLSLADKVGRKPLIRYGLVFHAVIMVFVLICRWPQTVFLFMALQGIQVATTGLVAYVLLLEMVPTNLRSFFCAMLNTVDGGITSVLLPIFYYYIGDWQILFIFNLLLTLFVFALHFWVTESPRYYLARKRFDSARNAFSYIGRINGRDALKQAFEQQVQNQSATTPLPVQGLSEVCKPHHRGYLIALIVIPLLWFTVDFVYYGINFGLSSMKGSIYLNGMIAGGAELFSYLAGGILSQTRLGRKGTAVLCYFIGGVACVLYCFTDNLYANYGLLLLGKFGSGAIFFVVYMLTTQLFPTVVRGTVFGIANVCARLGGIVAPVVDALFPHNFMLAFGIMGLLSCAGGFFLKETKGKPLKDVFEDRPLKH